MKRLLICTIMRDAEPHARRWYDQLIEFDRRIRDEYETSLSVYENDSRDETRAWLHQWVGPRQRWIPFGKTTKSGPVWLTTETLGTARYGSIWSEDRIRNLAAARQKCLDQAGDLSRFDKIAYIEPDVTYDPVWAAELVLARHPAQAGIEPDIYSGWSLRTLKHPKESTFLYDTCATRATSADTCWDVNEEGGKWRGKSIVRTDLGGVDSNCLHRVWSTFNCFCVYNAKPFKEGLRWGYVNHRLDPSGIYIDDGDYGSGWLDADTSVMCEEFRARGYSNVLLNTNVLIRHG